MAPLLSIVIAAAIIIVAILAILNIYGSLYHKVGPNRALIVYGSGKMRVITGGAELVIPVFRRAEEFSLELMSFDVAPQQDLYTNQGVAVRVEAVTQLKVRSDQESILTAAEQFLSKDAEEREGLIRLVMEGHLRGIVGQLTVEQIVKEPEMVSEKMRSICSADLAKMGLEVVSFTIREVRDENGYIANMGRPEIERVKKEANIATALAARDTQIQQANAVRQSAVAKAEADQARVEAEAASQAKQAEFQRDLALKKASYDAEVRKEQVTAEKASDLQGQVMQQQIVAESAKAQQIERTAQIKVQEAEAQRRQMELDATVVKQAQAEKQRVELDAAARAAALRAAAEAEAQAVKIRGAAEAEAARLKGLAQAEVIRAQGEAEAEAMRTKAAAYHEYNQAALLDKVIGNLPEMVRAMAEPLAKVDKISILSTGSGGNGTGGNLGASRVTGDLVNVLAQVPLLFEALTGTRMSDLLARVPAVGADDDGIEPATTVPAASVDGSSSTKAAPEPVPAAVVASETPGLNGTK